MNNKNEVMVSVICTTYNHCDSLKKCLDSMVCQKTNFNFEIIVHDDNSSDGTTEILKDYAQKYPNLIIPMYEKENQYSQGVNIFDEIMLPVAKGKYYAFCEGDDYWCDENKLQLQYDFMESNPQCSACFHNTIHHDLGNITPDKKFNNFNKVHFLTPHEAIVKYLVHTSSYFFRSASYECPIPFRKYWFGDYVLLTMALTKGALGVLPQVMSVYNFNNPVGLVYQIKVKPIAERIRDVALIKEYLEAFNQLTHAKYKQEVKAREVVADYEILNIRASHSLGNCEKRREFYCNRKKIKQSAIYKEVIKQQHGVRKLKTIVRYNSPYWLWKRKWKV